MSGRVIGFIIAGLFLITAISIVKAETEIVPQDWPEVPFTAREIDVSNAGKGHVNVTVELENPYAFDIAKRIPVQLEVESNNETMYLTVYAKNHSKILDTQEVPIPFRIAFKELNITYTIKAGNISKTFTVPMPVRPSPRETVPAETPAPTEGTPKPEVRGLPAFEAIFSLTGLLIAVYLNRQQA